jgi:hypothetical protein
VTHKLSASLADSQLTADPLNPGPNWTGVQTANQVALFARQGRLQITADIQTTHAGVAQYLIAGLEGAHRYQVRRTDNDTELAVQAVSNADNTLYFEATAGTYKVFPTGLANLFLNRRPPAVKGKPFQYDFKNSAEATTYAWSIVAGKLPPGIALSADGVLRGIPSETGDFTATIQAAETESPEVAAAVEISFTVLPAVLNTSVGGASSAGAVLVYSLAGLRAQQTCTAKVSETGDFTSPDETLTDSGGAAQRTIVLGAGGSLTAGKTYSVKIACGAAEATTQFATLPHDRGAAELAIRVAVPPGRAWASGQVEYGSTPNLGQTASAVCDTTCLFRLPALQGTAVYVRRSFFDGAGRMTARSGITPFPVGQ